METIRDQGSLICCEASVGALIKTVHTVHRIAILIQTIGGEEAAGQEVCR